MSIAVKVLIVINDVFAAKESTAHSVDMIFAFPTPPKPRLKLLALPG